MEVQWVLVCHGMVTLTVVVSFLCGHSPVFKGTPIGWIHYFLTFGAWDYLLRFVEFVFGSKGTDAVLSVEGFCCDRPNPFLQIIYLLILGSTYFITVKSSFAYIPGYYIGEVHKYMSFGAVMIGVLLFLLTSFCDPGTVNAKNVSQYVSAYPYDDIIYSEKECPTYQLDPSTAASATVVWRGLIIIVVGWFVQQPQSFKMNLSLTLLVDNVIDTKLHVTE
ncbi:hypothetical protein F2Q70_00000334 [Brassica cretica]|uniref:Uncharacterized protein n=1 Tax=Brassica cretica TaxID=69181 RepID=A0A8S9IRG5_BRACR|nr:hypothetical protein F2Q70_00000334 [Brassica cretica]